MKELKSEGDINLGEERAKWYDKLDESTKEILREDEKYFMHQTLSTPCLNVITRAEGSYIYDHQDKAYLDFHGNSAHHVGYGNPAVKQAIIEQMEKLPFSPRRYTNDTAIAFAKKLTELAPGDLNRVLFAPGGTVAMGMALKLARAATGRHKTISLWDSFHGASLDMISIGGEAVFRKDAGPLLSGTNHVPPSDPTHCPFDCGESCSLKCADYIEYVLEKEQDVCAVIAETVRSTPYIPPKDYWKRIRNSCDKYGALLILDEIPHGVGRTGTFFTFEQYDIVPDIVVIGKSIGGGMLPLAAMIAREGLNESVKSRSIGHYTHEKNPIAMAVGLAVIRFIDENDLLNKVIEKGSYLRTGLEKLREKHACIGDIRGLGLLIGVELVLPDGSRALDLAEKVMYSCLELGLSFKISMGNVLTLTPALTISYAELDKALDILDRAIARQ
ncbi:(R)-1-hydroxy-2-aminoethylphosphonate ammonia-lyase [Lunatibacter salilacus]|uniref:(R)-1-hydroxy-2-aminoethylphosphonate ammonia-lyase n=1 Tax=Lunatibacter salilacus TaxID=2483804 RepID=UPI00131B7EF3|nr:aspartate aminotransferase family protein [Lunatibacter salilacus]